ILGEAHPPIEVARIEIVVPDERGVTLRPCHLRATGHIRRWAPHAEEAAGEVIVVRQAAKAVVDRDQLRHVEFQQRATSDKVGTRVLALAHIPDAEQRPGTIEEGLPALTGPGLADK